MVTQVWWKQGLKPVFCLCYYFISEFPLLSLRLLASPSSLYPMNTHKPVVQLCLQAGGGMEVEQQEPAAGGRWQFLHRCGTQLQSH